MKTLRISLLIGLLSLLCVNFSFGQINTQLSVYGFKSRLDRKLEKFNIKTEVVKVDSRRSDIMLNWKIDPYVFNTLLKSDQKAKTLGVIMGVMIACAAVVGEETTGVDWNPRNLVYKFNGQTLAHIPVVKCKRFVPLVKKKQVYTAIKEFGKYVVFYTE